jgi:hypothetical protein
VERPLRGCQVPLSVVTDGEDLEDVMTAAEVGVVPGVALAAPAASIRLMVELAAKRVRLDTTLSLVIEVS